ncbi:MAG: hypothetical protein R2838_19905 [Caldilineaceae bacterium]
MPTGASRWRVDQQLVDNAILEDLDLDVALLRDTDGHDVAAVNFVAGFDQPSSLGCRFPCLRPGWAS